MDGLSYWVLLVAGIVAVAGAIGRGVVKLYRWCRALERLIKSVHGLSKMVRRELSTVRRELTRLGSEVDELRRRISGAPGPPTDQETPREH